jgi:acyl carrier protein
MEEIKSAIRQFVLTRYLPGESPANLADNTPLQSSGILDSLAVLELASFIDVEFGVTLTAHETQPERFDRIEDIAALVTRSRRDDRRAS